MENYTQEGHDQLLEAMDTLGLSEKTMEALEQDFNEAFEAAALEEKTQIIRQQRTDLDQIRIMVARATSIIAKEHDDPLYHKMIKFRRLYISIKLLIQKKYGGQSMGRAKRAKALGSLSAANKEARRDKKKKSIREMHDEILIELMDGLQIGNMEFARLEEMCDLISNGREMSLEEKTQIIRQQRTDLDQIRIIASRAASIIAKEHNDPLYHKLIKFRKLYVQFKRQIQLKYAAQAMGRAKRAKALGSLAAANKEARSKDNKLTNRSKNAPKPTLLIRKG